MSSSESQVNPALIFDIQALTQINEASRKEMEKRQDEIRTNNATADEVLQEEIDQEAAAQDSKAQISKQDQIKDVIKSLPAQAGKMSKNSKKTATDQTSKANADTAKSALNAKQTKALVGTLIDYTNIKGTIKASGMPEMELDLDNGRVLDQILDRKNLMGCKATDAQLKQAKAQAKRMARTIRHSLKAALPSVSVAAAKVYAQNGVDVSAPEPSSAANPNAPSAKNPSTDSAIISAMLAALNMNELLQKLGINAEIDELSFEHDMSANLVAEAQKQFQANVDKIQAAKHKSCLSKALTIIGDVVGALFCWMGCPMIGVPIILAANGIFAKGIAALAKAMGVSDYVVQSIIMALTVLALVIANAATAGALTPMMAVTIALFVAGLVGWIDTTLGEIATHSDDPSKWPSWVTWASLGINIGVGLLSMGESVLSLIRTMGQMMSKLAGFITQNAGELLDSMMSSSASLTDSAEAVGTEMSEIGQPSSARPVSEIAETNIDEATNANTSSTGSVQGAAEGASGSGQAASASSAPGEASAAEGANGNGAAQGSSGNGTPTQASSSARVSPANAQEAQTVNSSAARAGMGQEMAMTSGQEDNESTMVDAIGASGRADAPEAYSKSAKAESTEEGATEKKLSFLQKALRSMLEKLMNMQRALGGALQDDASELAGMLKGAETTAEKADRIAQLIERMIMLSQKVGRWLLLGSQGAQSAVQFEMAECDKELASIIKEAADATAEVTLYEQFVATFNMAISTTEDNEQEYATDMSDELKLVGDIISAQRRNNNMLMTA